MTPTKHHRIGMIVPSSNTTMESEIPELLRRQQARSPHRFSMHAARLRLTQVTPEALRQMNDSADGAVDALCDAQVDALMYACLVAVMHGGRSCMEQTQSRLLARAVATGPLRPAVVTSAGALVQGLQALRATKVTMITPYRQSLTERVSAALAEYGIEVLQSHSLEVVDNVAVGRLDTAGLARIAARMDHGGAHALVLSACVQMPSLAVIEQVEQVLGLPVLSAATASTWSLLRQLHIEPDIPDAGSLLRKRAASPVPALARTAIRRPAATPHYLAATLPATMHFAEMAVAS